ncbi:GNAT family N-acetyltransferase [Micromonospora echinospora]|uniref:GNAT family N-acetyltransferase n=1 Tax=Micromonospora echinospora TaxID=1877 RepID=UPI003A839E22
MLTGELVALRAIEPGDAEALWRWKSDPEVTRWLDDGHPESLAQVTARLAKQDRNRFDRVEFGIETVADRRLVGLGRLRDATPESGESELDLMGLLEGELRG